jgi:RNA polymerase sigma factor (sigma-70 family)
MDEKPYQPSKAPDSFSSLIGSPELRAKLIRLARFRRIPAGDCEDIASEAIARAVSNQQEYDPDRASFFSWIKKITENVICSYYRRLNAQKRKAEGGMISLDAASIQIESKGPSDAFVQSQHASEELEYLIATTNLSEKEKKAIAPQRYQGDEWTEPAISHSTARRAREKVKQTKSDEKFGESPAGPDASECAYGKIPLAEHDTALLYDAARRIPWFVEAIARWRNSPEWKDLQAYLDSERALKRFPLAILREHWPEPLSRYRHAAHERDPVLRRRFEAAVEIALAFSEWPENGYCQLDPNERRLRLEQFGWLFGPEPFWEIDKRTFEIVVSAADDVPHPKFGLAGFLKSINEAPNNDSHAYSSVHLIRIDRRYPPKTIRESFNKWLAAEPKPGSNTIGRSGRRRTTRLVGFAGIRLMDDFDLSKAQATSWLKQRFGARIPSSPERFERAVATAREGLRDFLPSPEEMGI